MADHGSPFRTAPFDRALAMLERQGVPRKVTDHLREQWASVLGGKTDEDVARLLLRAIRLTCPRCTGLMPTEEEMGEYPGAKSRTDRTPGPPTEICSRCGDEEDDVWWSAPWSGTARVDAMRADRARWLLPEVAHPWPDSE